MTDPESREPLSEFAVTEEAARRGGWTAGRPTELADGASWWLPRIDWSLLLFRPGLVTSISRTFDLAYKVSRLESDGKRQTMAIAIYHAQLAQLGIELLQANYELPDEGWRRLLAFEQVGDMLKLTLSISEGIADSLRDWMPFHLTRGRAGADSLHSN